MKKIGIMYLGRRGGPTVDTLEMCKELVHKNNLFVLLSSQIENLNKFYELKEQYPDNMTIYTVKTYSNRKEFLFRTLNIFTFIKVARIIKKQKLSFLYQTMITYWGAILTIFLKNEKIVTAIHDPETHTGEENILFKKLYDTCIKKSNKYVIFSNKFLAKVQYLYNIRGEDVCILRLGGYLYYKKSELYRQESIVHNRILFFGRISEYKGLGNLLEAVKMLKSQGININLRVVGNGTLTEREKELICELKTSVELHNRWINDDEIQSFFQDIDFVVLPYIEATQSGIVMLSYAMNKAVLATNVGALDEQVTNETGKLVSPNNITALANGIREMYENNIFKSMGDIAYKLATEDWTWAKQSERLLEFMEK